MVLVVCVGKGMVFNFNDYDIWSVGFFFINFLVFLDQVLEGVLVFVQFDGWVKMSVVWFIDYVGYGKGFKVVEDVLVSLLIKYVLVLMNCGGVSLGDFIIFVCIVIDGVCDVYGIILVFELCLIGCMI